MKPIIFYIDDQEHALTAFEMNLPDEWQIYTYTSPLKAIADLKTHSPWVIVSDQLMPDITGVELLKIAAVHVPDAVRILTTAYSGEDLLIKSVQEAHVFGYIPKPWADEAIFTTLNQASEFYQIKKDRDEHVKMLEKKTSELQEIRQKMEDTLEELKAWTPPVIFHTITNGKEFPSTGTFVGIAYDIISSANIRDIKIEGKSLKNVIATIFTQMVLKHGGFIECHAGDYAYGHFDMNDDVSYLCNLAISSAKEFRTAIHSISQVHNIEFECGIAIHAAADVQQTVTTVSANFQDSFRTHKWYETDSEEVDLLHRIEKLVHDLPGSNIVITKMVKENLSDSYQEKFKKLGLYKAKGQNKNTEIFLCKSNKVRDSDIESLKKLKNIL